jgi:hypothetical protein
VHLADLASERGSRPTSEKAHPMLYGRAMRNVAKILKLRTRGQGLQEITEEVHAWVGMQPVTTRAGSCLAPVGRLTKNDADYLLSVALPWA